MEWSRNVERIQNLISLSLSLSLANWGTYHTASRIYLLFYNVEIMSERGGYAVVVKSLGTNCSPGIGPPSPKRCVKRPALVASK